MTGVVWGLAGQAAAHESILRLLVGLVRIGAPFEFPCHERVAGTSGSLP